MQEFPVSPISWIAVQMHHGHDSNTTRFDAEQHSKRKRSGQAPPHISLNKSIEFGIHLNTVQCVLNSSEKTLSKVLLLIFIPYRSIQHFSIGIGMKANRFHASAA